MQHPRRDETAETRRLCGSPRTKTQPVGEGTLLRPPTGKPSSAQQELKLLQSLSPSACARSRPRSVGGAPELPQPTKQPASRLPVPSATTTRTTLMSIPPATPWHPSKRLRQAICTADAAFRGSYSGLSPIGGAPPSGTRQNDFSRTPRRERREQSARATPRESR